MRNLIPARIYLFNFTRMIMVLGVTTAIAFIVYTTLFGSVW
jgi:hypothetical protein